jgi:hypothetical protein
MELEAQLPNELGTLVDWDPVPEQGVCVRLRFVLPQAKDPHLGTGSCRFTAFRVEDSTHCVMVPRPSTPEAVAVFC